MKKLILIAAIALLASCSKDNAPETNYSLKTDKECFTEDCTNQATVFVPDEDPKKPLNTITITIKFLVGSTAPGGYFEGQGYDANGNWYHFWSEWTYSGAPLPMPKLTIRANKLIGGPTYPGAK